MTKSGSPPAVITMVASGLRHEIGDADAQGRSDLPSSPQVSQVPDR